MLARQSKRLRRALSILQRSVTSDLRSLTALAGEKLRAASALSSFGTIDDN